MSKGIIRKVDELGRIVIPVEIRNKLSRNNIRRKKSYIRKISARLYNLWRSKESKKMWK